MHSWFYILLFVISAYATTISIQGIESMGITIDPVTYREGNNIFDITMCNYQNYYIPCGMTVEPNIVTTVEIMSEAFSQTHSYTYDKNIKVDVEASASFLSFKANGKYSSSSETNVDTMIKTNSSLVISDATVSLLNVATNMVSMKLNPELEAIINKTVMADINNDDEGVKYWISVLFQEFPPGIKIRGITGAKLHQTTYIENDYYHNTDTETVTKSASASCSFSTVFSASGSYNWGVTEQQIDEYKKYVKSFSAVAIGGHYTPTTNLSDWIDSAFINPVMLDYTVDLSLFWLQHEIWPQFPKESMKRIYESYVLSYVPYFNNNTHYGCTDPYGKNFRLEYNTDDGSCDYNYPTVSTYGGYYSWSLYSRNQGQIYYPSNNPFTGGLSCPTGTSAHCQYVHFGTDWSTGNPDCYQATGYFNCYISWWEDHYCQCVGDNNHPNGPAFGGAYSSTQTNPVTNDFNCPPGTIDHNKI